MNGRLDHRSGFDAEKRLGAAIDVFDAAVLVDDDDAVGGGIEDGGELVDPPFGRDQVLDEVVVTGRFRHRQRLALDQREHQRRRRRPRGPHAGAPRREDRRRRGGGR